MINHADTQTEYRLKLLRTLKKKSYFEGSFILASGKLSPYYIDCRLTTLSAEGSFLIGNIIFDLVKDLPISAIGGLTLGADPIASAVSVVSYLHNKPLDAFIVRKEAKDHGQGKLVEGNIQAGDQVVVVEDVITSGGSVIKAIQALQQMNVHVVKIIAILDRLEGGRENISTFGIDFTSLFTIHDINHAS